MPLRAALHRSRLVAALSLLSSLSSLAPLACGDDETTTVTSDSGVASESGTSDATTTGATMTTAGPATTMGPGGSETEGDATSDATTGGTSAGMTSDATDAPTDATTDATTDETTVSTTDETTDDSTTDATREYTVLVNSREADAVLRYDANGDFLGPFIAPGAGGLDGPEDILFHPDGSVLVTGFANTAIKRYDASGEYLSDFSTGYSLATPSKMSIGPDDLIYVTQWGETQNVIVRFTVQGAFVDEFVSAPKALGHFWDADGRLYVALFGDNGDGTVHRFDPEGADLGTFIDSAVLAGPTDIWTDTNGDVLVEDWLAGTVLRYSPSGEYIDTFLDGMTNPEGMAITPEGDLLIGDWGEDAVHRFDAQGEYLGYFAVGDGLIDPNCVVVWPDEM